MKDLNISEKFEIKYMSLENVPDNLRCSISRILMIDPIFDGHGIYEKDEYEKLHENDLQKSNCLPHDLKQKELIEFRENRIKECLECCSIVDDIDKKLRLLDLAKEDAKILIKYNETNDFLSEILMQYIELKIWDFPEFEDLMILTIKKKDFDYLEQLLSFRKEIIYDINDKISNEEIDEVFEHFYSEKKFYGYICEQVLKRNIDNEEKKKEILKKNL